MTAIFTIPTRAAFLERHVIGVIRQYDDAPCTTGNPRDGRFLITIILANAGTIGFSTVRFLTEEERDRAYRIAEEKLAEIQTF